MPLLWTDIGIRIQDRRMEMKITQQKLAEMTDLSDVYVGYIEQGKRKPSVESIARIAGALNCTVDDLLIGDPPTRSSSPELEEILGNCTKSEQQALLDIMHSLIHLVETNGRTP